MKKPSLLCRILCCYFAVYLALPASSLAQLTLSQPSFPTTNTVRLTLTGTTNNTAYLIFFTPTLLPDINQWTRYYTGAVDQTLFDLTKPTNANAFFRASEAPSPTPTVATPVCTPGGGSYGAPTNVTITCATDGAATYYTTNGSTPTTLDTFIYDGDSVYLTCSVTLKAKAFKFGYNDSAVATNTYMINCAPVVSAGPQQIISSSPATLQGYVTDDGLTGGGTRFTNWSKISGPGTVTFGNASQTNTTATFGTDGIYVLQLRASDGQYTNTNRVTIALNPTLSVSLISPADGATFTVPTNIILQATAGITGGNVLHVAFYTGSTLIGTATNEPYTFEWRSVPAGTQSLTAVATSDDVNNLSLASDPSNIAVNWPTNVGQLTASLNDLQIPVAGLPITVNRLYDTRYGTDGSFGSNWKLDYEDIKIEKTASLGQGYLAIQNLGSDCIVRNHDTMVTVSLGLNEKYYFQPHLVFQSGGTECIGHTTINYLEPVRWVFDSITGLGELAPVNSPPDVGMLNDNTVNGNWSGAIEAAICDDELCLGWTGYEPDWSAFTFTAPDGTQYLFASDGSLYQKIDRNGNSLTYNYDGIVHSSGKQISFTRDGSNRITEIYDPIALDTSGSPALTYAYAGNGNLTNVARLVQRSSPVYENTAYAYTNTTYTHHLTKITDARNVAIQRTEFDSSGRLFRQYDAAGYLTSYSYDLNNHRQTITDRLTNPTTQNFTLSGQVSSVQDAQGGVTQFGYDDRGRKVAETDALGQTTTYAYDNNDQLTGVTNELGAASSATYNDFGQVLLAIDARGNGTTNEYDANGNLIAVTNALSVVTRYGYDTQGNRVAETNAFGTTLQTVTLNQYDEFGYLTNVSDALGHTTSYTYDANANRLTQTTTRTTPTGTQTLTTTQNYDAANRVTRTVEPDGFTNKIVFNNIGKQAQTIDKLGRTNSFSYDARGFLTNTTYADGLYETFAYDAEGRRSSSVDRALRATSYTYDALGRLTRTTFADDSYTVNDYNEAGQLTATVQGPVPNVPTPSLPELVTYYTYDAAGRRTLANDALDQDTRFAYDANGNQTNVVDALNHTNTYVYDALNRRTQIIFPDGTSESTGYDALDRRIAVTNQAGVATRFGYDALGRLKAVTNAFGASQQMVTRYAYDEVGNQTNQVDALNRTNLFQYDAVGRRTKQILPGNQSQTFGYDAVGNLIRQTNFNGVILTNAYDSLNRLTNKSSAGGYTIRFAYNATSQRTNMVDASGTNTYTYDSRDRLLTKGTPQGTLTYTYDDYGNQATLQSSTTNGTKLTYSYDDLNRLTNVVDRFTNNTFYAFDAAGNLQTARYPNSVTNTWTYNALNRLTNLTAKTASGTIASFAYKLGAAGNRTNLIESLNSVNRTNTWAYDPLYRLTNEVINASSGPTGSITNKYDAVGNRTNRASSVTGVSSVTNSFNSNDQLTTDVYDSNGNTRTNGSDAFFYDVENRLTNAVVGGTNLTIIYDGDGNRVMKIVGTTTNFYLIDSRNPSGYPQVLEELSTVGSTPDRLYTYGLDLVSQRQSNGTNSFYGYDGNGNTRFLTGTNAAISDTYAYDAFGIVITNTGTTPNNYRYTGEQYDPNLGFYYLRARYLNPNTGRFWTQDSFEGSKESPASLHKYTYTHNDPIDFIDPSGHTETAFSQAATLTTISTLSAINVGATILINYQIARLAYGTLAANELQAVALRLGVKVETDPDDDSSYLYFDHGTSTGSWGNRSQIDPNLPERDSDFGKGFYTFQDNDGGRRFASRRAVQKFQRFGGVPFVLRVKVTTGDYSQFSKLNFNNFGNSFYESEVAAYRAGKELSTFDVVIGPTAAKQNGRWVKNPAFPDQYKFEGLNAISKLRFDAIIPVNGLVRY